FAIAFDCAQWRAEVMAKGGRLSRTAPKDVDRLCDQRGKLGRGRPHPLEIRQIAFEPVSTRVLDEDFNETNNCRTEAPNSCRKRDHHLGGPRPMMTDARRRRLIFKPDPGRLMCYRPLTSNAG